jgi:bacillithiol system protein YtxJ
MGLINALFGDSSKDDKKEPLPWIPLTSEDQIGEIKAKSKTKPQFIFKHSTRCGISRMTLSQFEAIFQQQEMDVDLYFLDLLAFRSLSNQVSDIFQVMHQSPQLLIIKNGVVVAHESHSAINNLHFKQYV